jgi:hypothetical protein
LGQRLAPPKQARTTSGRIRFLGASLLEIPPSLLASLHELAIGIDGDGHAVGELLDALIRELESFVQSYRGLQLTISQNGFPLVLTALADGHDRPDGAVTTSLRVPLALLDSGFASDSRIVFYAGMSGAFVDLSADLEFALRRSSTAELVADSTLAAIRLDADPPPRTRGFNLSGLTELSTVDRAVGAMIAQGHDPDHAHATLRRDAEQAGMEPHTWAAQVLRRTGPAGSNSLRT